MKGTRRIGGMKETIKGLRKEERRKECRCEGN